MGKNKRIEEPMLANGDSSDEEQPEEIKAYNADSRVLMGPIKERKTTDCWCTLVFLAVFVAGIGLSINAYNTGNFDYMIAPIDGDNRVCGYDSDVVDYKYLYIFDVEDAISGGDIFKYGICVDACPIESDTTLDCVPTTESYKYSSDCSFSNSEGDDTEDFFGYCIPTGDDRDAIFDQVRNMMSDLGFSFLIDIQTTETTILIGFGTSILFSFLYIWLMHRCAVQLSWAVIIAFEVLTVGAGAYSFTLASAASSEDDSEDQQKYQYFAYFLFGLAVLYFFVVCCFRNSINLAVHIMDAAADFVVDTKRAVFVPLSFFVMSAAFLIVWMFGYISILSQGEIGTVNYQDQSKDITWSDQTVMQACFMIFSLIWVFCFFMACSQFVIIVGASTWFFSWDKEEKDGDANLSLGYYWVWRYHLGSIAFGSFVLAVIWTIQIVFEMFKRAAKKSGASDNAIAKCLLNCITCYIQCLKKCVEYINENAYIEMALRGEGFCTSAKDGACLMLKHTSRFVMTSGIGRLFGFLGKLAICACNLMVVYVLLENWSDNDAMVSPTGPLFLVFVFTWVVSDIFVGIFAIAADTFLHCFIMEEDVNAHSDNHTVRAMPENLQTFISENRKGHKTAKQVSSNNMN